MREFFRGWRRKIGLLALMMACVVMAGWVRSRDTFDSLAMNSSPWRFRIESAVGQIHLNQSSFLDGKPRFRFLSIPLKRRDGRAGATVVGFYVDKKGNCRFNPEELGKIEWRRDGFGFHISSWTDDDLIGRTLIVPYWSIVVPLTLVSVLLLLTKPRPAKSMKITEPTPAEGT